MHGRSIALLLGVAVCILIGPPAGLSQEAGKAKAPPAARRIPGLTAKDEFPKACVSCHVNLPEKKEDERLSTLMKPMSEKVEPALLAKAQLAAPAGVKLQGKHPRITPAMLRNIPGACIKCHTPTSKKAPGFDRMMHLIHLAGGGENHFLSEFQGECTHCHKLNEKTGAWSVPSAPEP